MKAFTIYLEQSKRAEWKEAYLNYGELKNILQKFAERRSRVSLLKSPSEIQRLYPSTVVTVKRKEDDDFVLMDSKKSASLDGGEANIDSILERTAQIEREEFCYVLDNELDKVARFYLDKIQELKKKIGVLEIDIDDGKQLLQENSADEEYNHESSVAALIDRYQNRYQILGDELLELNLYVGANIVALRQILTRYDSMIRTLDGPPLGHWYIVTRRGMGIGCENFQFESLFIHHGLTLIADNLKLSLRNLLSEPDFRDRGIRSNSFRKSFLSVSLRRIKTSLVTHKSEEEHSAEEDDDNNRKIDSDTENGIDRYIRELISEMGAMEDTMVKAEKRIDIAGQGRMAVTDSLLHTLRYYFLAGSTMNEMLIQPSIIRTRGVSLKREMRFFAKWRMTRKITFERHVTRRPEKSDIKSFIKGPLILNLTSQLLYMMNHYIIEPSSTKYIHTLGGNDAMSGLMISMAPWAALISAFVYSLWSNKSYRQPLICSGFFLVAGSLMYASALKFYSIPLAMSGRFVSGLGAPCGVNIRYIADTVPSVHRTAASAIFMTVSALGMSMGPGMAVLLDFLDFEFNVPLYGQVIINGMTGPGYLMFLLWSLYLFVLILIFRDGERIGLHEMAEKERRSTQPAVGTMDSHYSPPLSVVSSASTSMGDFNGSSEEGSFGKETEVTVAPKDFRRVINQATAVCMVLKFMGKFNLEVLNCSTSLMSSHRYNWTVKNIGLLGFVNGCLVIPITMFVGFLSQYYTDQKLLLCLLGVAFVGVALLLDPTDFFHIYDDVGYNSQIEWYSVGPKRYIAGQIIEFCGFQASQSVVMSMLSKVVPLSLAKGTFNSGFITTALTTLARALGDVFITIMGLASLRQLLNLLVVPCLMITLASFALAILYRRKLSI